MLTGAQQHAADRFAKSLLALADLPGALSKGQAGLDLVGFGDERSDGGVVHAGRWPLGACH